MFQHQTIKFWPRFARFPCQTLTRSGDITRPDGKPAPTRPHQMRDIKPHRLGRLRPETALEAGQVKSLWAGGWPPRSGIARIRSGECRACPYQGAGAGGGSVSNREAWQ